MKTVHIVSLLAIAMTSAALCTHAFAHSDRSNRVAQCYEKSALAAGTQTDSGLSVRITDRLHPETVNGKATGKWISTGDFAGRAIFSTKIRFADCL